MGRAILATLGVFLLSVCLNSNNFAGSAASRRRYALYWVSF